MHTLNTLLFLCWEDVCVPFDPKVKAQQYNDRRKQHNNLRKHYRSRLFPQPGPL